MIRALSALALAAVLCSPVFAQQGNQSGQGNRGGQGNRSGQGAMSGRSGGMMAPGMTYPAYERRLPNRFYRDRIRLTPGDFYRLRAQGFSRDEVFMIANASRETGLEYRIFADAVYRGMYARDIAYEYGISPRQLTWVNPEWKTAEWAAATGESVYTRDKLNVWY